MSEVKRNLSEIDAQLRVITRTLRDSARDARLFAQQLNIDPSNLKLAGASAENVKRQIELTNKQIEVLKERLSQTKDSTSDIFIKLNNQLEIAESKINTLNKELVKINNAKFDSIQKSLSGVTKIAQALLGALVGVGAALIKLGGDLKALSIKTGVTVEEIQQLDYVFEQLTGTSGQFQDVLKATITLLGLVAKNSARASANLASIGLTLDDIRGKSPEDALMIIIDALKQIDDTDKRLAAASALFGSLGTVISNFTELSQEEINALIADLEELGIVSDESATAALELKRAWNALMREFKAVIIQLGVDLLPLFRTLIELAINLVPILVTIGNVLTAIGPAGQMMLFVVIVLAATLPKLIAGIKAVNGAMLLLGANPIAFKILFIATAVAALIMLLVELSKALSGVFGRKYSLDIDTSLAEGVMNGTNEVLTSGTNNTDASQTTTVYDYSTTNINVDGDVDVDDIMDAINTRKIQVGG